MYSLSRYKILKWCTLSLNKTQKNDFKSYIKCPKKNILENIY
jgi:hypothetical protein